MLENTKVSVVIVNWNGAEHLRYCLPSLNSQSLKPQEIIVVDNRSSDDSQEAARIHGARWVPLQENVGLAPGLNRGAAAARGDFLLFVNNDMRFDPGFIAALAEPFERDEKMFATDGMQFNWDGMTRGHLATRLTSVRPRRQASTELVPGLYFYAKEESTESPVFMASAACMMVRRSVFEQLGGFDERLPLGYEDVEICWRAWVQGKKVVYVPSAICWHRVGSSIRSIQAARFSFRGVLTGRLLFATKLLPTPYAIRTWLISAAGLGKDIGRLQWGCAKDRLTVLSRMSGQIGPLLRERKALFAGAKRRPVEQLDFFLCLTHDNEPQGSALISSRPVV
jgi:GT2 family glycosyltransferase